MQMDAVHGGTSQEAGWNLEYLPDKQSSRVAAVDKVKAMHAEVDNNDL